MELVHIEVVIWKRKKVEEDLNAIKRNRRIKCLVENTQWSGNELCKLLVENTPVLVWTDEGKLLVLSLVVRKKNNQIKFGGKKYE